MLDPRFLYSRQLLLTYCLNRFDLFSFCSGNGENARARGNSIDVNGARATGSNPTTIFGSCHVENITQHPKQRHGWLNGNSMLFTVYVKYHKVRIKSAMKLTHCR